MIQDKNTVESFELCDEIRLRRPAMPFTNIAAAIVRLNSSCWFAAAKQPRCPECDSSKLEKLLSVPAAHTAGSRDLPDLPAHACSGGCGLPQCGMGGCGME